MQMRIEIEDFKKALLEAANNRKPLIVFKATADRGIIIREVNVHEAEVPFWTVSSIRTVGNVAIDADFATVEDASASCAEWLFLNGYSIR